MTTDQLNQVINLLAAITLFEMMVSIGLGVSLGDVVRVVKDWQLVSKAGLANYVFVPAAAIGLLLLFDAHPYVAAGFLIVAVCPGAPFGPPFTALARGNAAVSVGLMVMLAGSSAVLAPVLLSALLPWVLGLLAPLPENSPPLAVDGVKVVTTLLLAQFLPLCIGLALRYCRPSLSDRLMKPAGRLSSVLNLVLLALILWAQFDMLAAIPLRGYVGMSVLVLASIAVGALLSDRGNRSAMVMATAVRNVGVCLVIVTAAFPGTPAVAAVTAFALFQTILMVIIAVLWGRWVHIGPQSTSTQEETNHPAATAAS